MPRFLSRDALTVNVPGRTGKMYSFSKNKPTIVDNPLDVAKFKNTQLLREIDETGKEIMNPKRGDTTGTRNPNEPLSYKKMSGAPKAITPSRPARPGGQLGSSDPQEVQARTDDSPDAGDFVCDVCGKTLPTQKGLDIHKKRIHS